VSVSPKRVGDPTKIYPGYYATILRDIPQISKSGFLRVLRENDPFKAKWTILAKAYSLVRDDNLG
jgi:hypothetical protein